MLPSELVWENKENFGCEYAKVFSKENNIIAESTVIYLDSFSPVQIDYRIELDLAWRTKNVNITNRTGMSLHLTSSEAGEWFGQDGKRIHELSGAIDIDISATPFSNSLPINRFAWELGQTRKFEMVYISVPNLDVSKEEQTYSYVEEKGKSRIFRYHCRNYEALISVDEAGFVVEYPQLFHRRY